MHNSSPIHKIDEYGINEEKSLSRREEGEEVNQISCFCVSDPAFTK
jgi:hypothetical protein